MAALTDKQKIFCAEYMVDLNATQAAIRAGYSPKYANRQATANMAKPEIQAEIERLRKKREKRTRMSANEILDVLETIIQTNVTEFMVVTKGNRVKVTPTDQVDEEKLVALAGVKKGAKGAIEVKTYNKLDALQLLMRHKGMLNDKVKVEGNVNHQIDDEGLKEILRLAGFKK